MQDRCRYLRLVCVICAVAVAAASDKTVTETEAKQIGGRLRERRLALGLSQSQLATRLRTRTGKAQSVSKISQWERGESAPEPSKRPEIADALQTTVLALFGDPADETVLPRLDLLERRLEAVILLQGLSEAVEGIVRQGRQAARRSAQGQSAEEHAAAAKDRLTALKKPRAPRGKSRAKGKKAAGG